MPSLEEELIQLLDEPGCEAEPRQISGSEQKVNKQLYANSPLAGSAVEAAAKEGLFNTKLPNLAIVHEKPEHRQIVFFKAQGFTNREIAARTDYTEPWISQITRQPWFQIRLLAEMNLANRGSIQDFVQAQLEPSILALIDLRDHAESEPVKLGATINMLDRILGKPVQRVESKIEMTQREQRLGTIEEQLSQLDLEEQKLRSKLGGNACIPVVGVTVPTTALAGPVDPRPL